MIRRKGNRARRKLEFRTIVRRVKRNKASFIKRLQARAGEIPKTDCIVYRGAKVDGYPIINFRLGRKHVQITAGRVFLILKLARPIAIGCDAGHEPWCPRRDCVRHVFEQPMSQNYSWSGANHVRA